MSPSSLAESAATASCPSRVSTPAPSDLRVVLVMNLMTEPGETDGHTGADHIMAVRRHAPTIPIHDVLISTTALEPAQIARYASLNATPVRADVQLLRALGHAVVESDLLAAGADVRHDPEKLGRALIERAS